MMTQNPGRVAKRQAGPPVTEGVDSHSQSAFETTRDDNKGATAQQGFLASFRASGLSNLSVNPHLLSFELLAVSVYSMHLYSAILIIIKCDQVP
jgi:hypothetical protein